MKKNYSLFLGIAICFLAYVLLSWIIPTATVSNNQVVVNGTSPVGLFGLVYYPGITIGTFIQFGLIILAIGGLYGVLVKTGVYAKLVNNFVKKMKGKEKTFLIVVIASLAFLNSISGVPFALLIIVPFLMAVVLKLGYNKITAVAATVGAMLIGSLGSTFGTNVAGAATSALGIDITVGILPRAILLVVVTALYIMFVLSNKDIKKAPKTKSKTKSSAKNEKVLEDSKEKILFLEDETETKKKTLPAVILLVLTIVVSAVSMFSWHLALKLDFFVNLYEDIIAITIGDYPIFQNLLGMDRPFGYWDSYELVALLVISSLVIGWVYNLKIKDTFEGFIEGARKVIKPAIYITIANIIFTLMLSASNGFMLTWITDKLASISEGFNLFSVATSSLIGGFFYNHFYHLFSAVGQVFVLSYDSTYYGALVFIIQSFYGLVMLILPTSLFLVSGLTLTDVSYKEWIKYIWKFLLEVLLIVIIISVIVVLVV